MKTMFPSFTLFHTLSGNQPFHRSGQNQAGGIYKISLKYNGYRNKDPLYNYRKVIAAAPCRWNVSIIRKFMSPSTMLHTKTSHRIQLEPSNPIEKFILFMYMF